jgi:hypothetical protein
MVAADERVPLDLALPEERALVRATAVEDLQPAAPAHRDEIHTTRRERVRPVPGQVFETSGTLPRHAAL